MFMHGYSRPLPPRPGPAGRRPQGAEEVEIADYHWEVGGRLCRVRIIALTCVSPPNPGEMLAEEFLKPLRMTQKELAKRRYVSLPPAGHIHYWIDNASDLGLIPAIADTTFRLLVPAGEHKIRAELVQDDHGSFADGYAGKRVNFTSDPKYFAPRPTMDTITIFVAR